MRRLNDLSITAKMAVVTSIPLIFIAILAMMSLSGINDLQQSKCWVEHTHDDVLKVTEIENSLVDL